MILYQWISLALAALCISMRAHFVIGDAFYRVCYFASWAKSRTNLAKHTIEDIDPFLCTHLIFAFAGLDTQKAELKATDPNTEEGENGDFKRFTGLKSKNEKLKTLISVGGEKIENEAFVNITDTGAKIAHFTNTTVTFLRDRNFDGIDIDWEFPTSASKENVNKLLKSLRGAFDAEAVDPERRLLLTMAVSQANDKISTGYDVEELTKYLDFANLMTYDYSWSGNEITAFNSPLYSRTGDARFNQQYSTNWTVHRWIELGLPLSKIVVGVTGVGRRLVLLDQQNTEPGSLTNTTAKGKAGEFYLLPGALAYPEICLWLKNTSTVRKFDEQQKNPYLVYLDNWVGYEDEESIRIKVEWMESLGVKGLMFWALDQDDFSGKYCNNVRYPLLSLVKMLTTPNSTTSASTASTTASTTFNSLSPSTNVTMTTAPQTTEMASSNVSSTLSTTKKTTPRKILATPPSIVVGNNGHCSSLQKWNVSEILFSLILLALLV